MVKNHTHFIVFMAIITCLSLNNKLLKIIKESLIYTLPDGGNILIPFIKLVVVVPFSIGILAIARLIQRRLGLYYLFQISSVAFISFYLFFLWFLYPNRESLSINISSLNWFSHWFPFSVHLFFKHWVISFFYVLGDMWSMVFISVLFWNIAALVFSINEAKKYYPIFSLDIAGIVIGFLALFGSIYIKGLILNLIIITIIQMGLLYAIKRNYSITGTHKESVEAKKAITSNKKVPFVLLLGATVFSYEFSDNFLDYMWKWRVSQLYSSPEAYSQYMSQVVLLTGSLGVITCLFLVKPLVQRLQWRTFALISPGLAFIFTTAFLITQMAQFSLETIVFMGLIMSSCMQITKYTFFDNAKELAILSQDRSNQFYAKSFADGLMTRCGKSSASFFQQILLIILLNVEIKFQIYAGVFVMIALFAWILTTYLLAPYVEGKTYADCTSH